MDLGNKLLELRKKKGMSQEEVADIIGVSRQTVSKWETGTSQPEFERIKPLCDLYEISVEELITGKSVEKEKEEIYVAKHKSKKALLLILSIFLYFLSIILIVLLEGFGVDENIMVSIFLLICAIATCLIIYTSIVFSHDKISKSEKKKTVVNPKFKSIEIIISIICLIIFLLLGFLTNAWHIVWIIWLVYAVVIEIVKLVFQIKGEKIEDEE